MWLASICARGSEQWPEREGPGAQGQPKGNVRGEGNGLIEIFNLLFVGVSCDLSCLPRGILKRTAGASWESDRVLSPFASLKWGEIRDL